MQRQTGDLALGPELPKDDHVVSLNLQLEDADAIQEDSACAACAEVWRGENSSDGREKVESGGAKAGVVILPYSAGSQRARSYH